MGTIAVVGAGGVTGRRLVSALADAGHRTVAASADARDEAAVVDAVDLVIVAARGPERRGAWLETAAHHGTHAIDAGIDPTVAVRAFERLGGPARASGVTVLPAAGAAVGDLLAVTSVAAVDVADEVHVCWAFPDRGGWRRALAPGVRANAADLLAAPVPVVRDGRRDHEHAGETRRLAWFPRPIGPVHAAAVPGPEPVMWMAHAAAVQTARTYLALPAWRAEVLQATASLVRRSRPHRVIARRLEQGADPAVGAESPRWACVAESRGRDGVARAWAYGRDAVGLGVAGIVVLAARLLDGGVEAGVLPPAAVGAPSTLLDRLSVASGLRWSVARPVAAGGGGATDGS